MFNHPSPPSPPCPTVSELSALLERNGKISCKYTKIAEFNTQSHAYVRWGDIPAKNSIISNTIGENTGLEILLAAG